MGTVSQALRRKILVTKSILGEPAPQLSIGGPPAGPLWVAAPMDALPKILEALEELDQAKEPIEPTLEPTG